MLSRTVRIRLTKRNSEGELCVLLVLENPQVKEIAGRKDNPFFKPKGAGLPGGRAHPNETEGRAAIRELDEETGLIGIRLRKIAEIDHSNEDNEHVIHLFEGEVPDADASLGAFPRDEGAIVKAEWVPMLIAFGSLCHGGEEYPIYKSHMELIYRTHKEIKRYEEMENRREQKENEECPEE